MALAVCEAVDDDGRLGVRLKWPNDLYAETDGVGGTEVGSGKKGRAKLGGILVNTNFVGGQWRVVIGKFQCQSVSDPVDMTGRMWNQYPQCSPDYIPSAASFSPHLSSRIVPIWQILTSRANIGKYICEDYECIRDEMGAIRRGQRV